MSDDNRFSFCLANDLSIVFFLSGTGLLLKDFYCLANTRHQIFCIHYTCLSPLFDNTNWTRRVWDRVLLHKKWTAKVAGWSSGFLLSKSVLQGVNMRFSCDTYETSRLTARAGSLFYPRSLGLGKTTRRTILKSTQKRERSTLKNGVDFIMYATKMVWTNCKLGWRKPRISQYHFQDFPGKSAWSQLARESGSGKREAGSGGVGNPVLSTYECAEQNNKLVLARNFGSFSKPQ